MSYGGTAELDPVCFTDEAFPSQISLNPGSEVQAEATGEPAQRGAQKPRKMKNAEISTEVLYYADAETNTKYKKKDVDVSSMHLFIMSLL